MFSPSKTLLRTRETTAVTVVDADIVCAGGGGGVSVGPAVVQSVQIIVCSSRKHSRANAALDRGKEMEDTKSSPCSRESTTLRRWDERRSG